MGPKPRSGFAREADAEGGLNDSEDEGIFARAIKPQNQ